MKFNYTVSLLFLLSIFTNNAKAMWESSLPPCYTGLPEIPTFNSRPEAKQYAIKSRAEHAGHECNYYYSFNDMLNELTKQTASQEAPQGIDVTDGQKCNPQGATPTVFSKPANSNVFQTEANEALHLKEAIKPVTSNKKPPETILCPNANLSEHFETNSFLIAILQNQGEFDQKLIEAALKNPKAEENFIDHDAYIKLFVRYKAKKDPLFEHLAVLPTETNIRGQLNEQWEAGAIAEAEDQYEQITGNRYTATGHEYGACALPEKNPHLLLKPDITCTNKYWLTLILTLLTSEFRQRDYTQDIKLSLIESSGTCIACNTNIAEGEKPNHIRQHIGQDTSLMDGIKKIDAEVLAKMFKELPDEAQTFAKIFTDDQ